MRLIENLSKDVREAVPTEACLLETRAIEKAYPILSTQLPPGKWLIASDSNTWEAAGARLERMLDSEEQSRHHYSVEPESGHQLPVCTDAQIKSFEAAIERHGASGAIAVGSGTINDIVKRASHNCGIPMGVVGTAPSMNGYVSSIAAVLSDGVKTSVPCTAPRFLIADDEVFANAPTRMIQSGLGDLLSKPVSNADWQLSAILKQTPHSKRALQIIERAEKRVRGISTGLRRGAEEGVRALTEGLVLSGVAMSVAGSSSPASGGEHLISHYIDMTGHAFDKPMDFHGCQVGVGTCTTALLYEKLDQLNPETIEPDRLTEALPPWPKYAQALRNHYGPLYEAIETPASNGYPEPDELRQRLETLKSDWQSIVHRVGKTLRSARSLSEQLAEAGAPVSFSELGLDRARAKDAIVRSKDIRDRYTVLHLLWELGLIDKWGTEAVERMYRPEASEQAAESDKSAD